MSNYPDDIHKYDRNPLSPFYTPPRVECECCPNTVDVDYAYTIEEKNFCSEQCLEEWLEDNGEEYYGIATKDK